MFFFFSDLPFQVGQRCEIIINDPRHATMPKLFPDRVGEKVIITQVSKDHVWAHKDEPIKYRTNNNGRQVVQFDPQGVNSPYHFDELRAVVNTPESQRGSGNWVNDWLRT